VLFSTLLLVLVSSPALAQDPGKATMPDVAMFRGNAARTGVMPGPGPDPEQGLGVRWRVDTGAVIGSSPAVADGVVYIGSWDGSLFALDAATGAERWRFTTPEDSSPGASPAVADGVVYIGSATSGIISTNPGGFYAIDARSGEQCWEFSTGGDFISSPLFADGVIYVGEVPTSDSLEGQPGLHALDAASGEPIWHVREATGVVSSPALSDGIIYAGTLGGDLIAVDAASGDERWRFTTASEIHSSPTVADGTVYLAGFDGTIFAIDAASGRERWRVATGSEIDASPAVAHGRMYIVTSDGALLALNGASGELVWEHELEQGGDDIVPSPAIVDEMLYVGNADGQVLAIDAQSGEVRAAYDAGGWTESSPTIVDGVIYIGQESGSVYALEDAAMDLEPSQGVVTDKPTTLFAGPSIDRDVVASLDEMTLVMVTQGLDIDGERWWGVNVAGTDQRGFIRATDLRTLPVAEAGPPEASASMTMFEPGDLARTNKQAGLYPSPSPAAHMFGLVEANTLVELRQSAVDTENQVWWSVSVVDSTEMGWIREADLAPASRDNEPDSAGSIPEEDGASGEDAPPFTDCPPEPGVLRFACPPAFPVTPKTD
jgi:outer membrane protein assembly factor BamB